MFRHDARILVQCLNDGVLSKDHSHCCACSSEARARDGVALEQRHRSSTDASSSEARARDGGAISRSQNHKGYYSRQIGRPPCETHWAAGPTKSRAREESTTLGSIP